MLFADATALEGSNRHEIFALFAAIGAVALSNP
jgi:hypothetical protein